MKTWTITDLVSDGSWAATYEAETAASALEELAQDSGFDTFAAYCAGKDRVLTDFAVVLDIDEESKANGYPTKIELPGLSTTTTATVRTRRELGSRPTPGAKPLALPRAGW